MPTAFTDWLYHDSEVENLLAGEQDIPPYATPSRSLYFYLVDLDFRSPASLLNAQDAISQYLDKQGVKHNKSQTFANVYGALLKAQPKWLDIPAFYVKQLMDESDGKSSKELGSWLKTTIAERFKFLKTPPKWIQSPQWMFEGNRPLIFVGQIDVSALQHDSSQLYLFFDPEQSKFFTTMQSA